MASGEGNERTPRMPKDMKGLLQFCVEATKAEDPTDPSHFNQMPQEKKDWLENALKDMSVSPVERMKMCLMAVKTEGDTEAAIDRKIAAVEELIEWCEQIDFAIDFHKIGGFEILSGLLSSEVPDLRWLCLELIATLVQNNPYCQAAVLQADLMPTLLARLDTDENATVRTKALLAISCLSRDSSEAQTVFSDNDGFSVLMRALQSDVDKLKIKAAFLLSNTCSDQPVYKDVLCDIGMIEQLVGHLSEEHSQIHEHMLGALLAIVRNHRRATDDCRRPELNLEALLKARIEFLADKEEFQEEREYAMELLDIVQGDASLTLAR